MGDCASHRARLFCAPGRIRTCVGHSPSGLQPDAFDHSATDATEASMPHFCACYNIFMLFRSRSIRWVTVLLILIAISPSITFAQFPTKIVPCDGTSANGGVECDVCHIGQLAQNVLNAGIYIAVFLSAILFAYAGWQYITAGGEPGKATEAKKIFWMVGVGLILILSAWLIVDLIMKVMLKGGDLGPLGPWNSIC